MASIKSFSKNGKSIPRSKVKSMGAKGKTIATKVTKNQLKGLIIDGEEFVLEGTVKDLSTNKVENNVLVLGNAIVNNKIVQDSTVLVTNKIINI